MNGTSFSVKEQQVLGDSKAVLRMESHHTLCLSRTTDLVNTLGRHMCKRVGVAIGRGEDQSPGDSLFGVAQLLISEGTVFDLHVYSTDDTAIPDLGDRVSRIVESIANLN